MRLRPILALALLAAVASAPRAGERAGAPKVALKAIKKLGGLVRHEGGDPTRPVSVVDLSHIELGKDGLKRLGPLPKLRALYLNNTDVEDEALKALTGL